MHEWSLSYALTTGPLSGMTIAVVGGLSRNMPHFRKFLNGLGAYMVYVSANSISHTMPGLQAADVVVLLTAGLSHKTVEKVTANVSDKPVLYVNSMGVSSFKREINEFIRRRESDDDPESSC